MAQESSDQRAYKNTTRVRRRENELLDWSVKRAGQYVDTVHTYTS